MIDAMSGKLIVIDGGDGAGKATQVALLVKRLEQEGVPVETLDFPRYRQNLFGKLIRECLDGKRGDFMTLDAHIASTLYAADRFESKPQIEQWLREGKTVILDRYVSANMLHQGAKIEDVDAVESFLTWIDHMEHGVFQLPRPDMIIYLSVPHEIRKELKAHAVSEGKHNAALDQAERSDTHQQSVHERAKDIVATLNQWVSLECASSSGMRSREDIHQDVYQLVSRIMKT
jgi:dTMP kinase